MLIDTSRFVSETLNFVYTCIYIWNAKSAEAIRTYFFLLLHNENALFILNIMLWGFKIRHKKYSEPICYTKEGEGILEV